MAASGEVDSGMEQAQASEKAPERSPSMRSNGSKKKELGALDWTGKCFGGLRLDIKRRGPYYLSDFTDAFRLEDLGRVIATVLFLFFAAVAPAITFGNLYEKDSKAHFGVVETIIATAVSGVLYSLFAGQPITVLGATGPIFAYTIVCFNLSEMFEVEFMPFYFWTIMWCALLTVLMVAFDLCALMRHVTPFSEDIFAGLISVIFIVEAVKPAIKGFTEKGEKAKSTEAAFLELVLEVVTYKLCTELTCLRRTPWLTPMLRGGLANFGVCLAIAAASGLAAVWGDVKIDMLDVSSSIRPTLLLSDGQARGWIVSPFGTDGDFPIWAVFFGIVPAIGFALLGYLDQNLTTVLVNRPSRQLKKPPGYHLDLLVRAVICTPVCALLGLPLAVASTVPSLTHLMSLTTYTVERLPEGERKVPEKVCEQRVSNMLIHVLLGLSLAFAPALKYVPKSVLFGVFLFMGVASLNGNGLFERLFLWGIWDTKAYPQFDYVQELPARRIHAYTLFQGGCLGVLYGLSAVKQTAVVFPFFMASLMIIRKVLLVHLFTEGELKLLDGVTKDNEEDDIEADIAPIILERQHSPWDQGSEPEQDIPFARGVSPMGREKVPRPGFGRQTSAGSSASGRRAPKEQVVPSIQEDPAQEEQLAL